MNDRNPRVNALGQPIGFEIPDWRAPPHPPRTVLTGHDCRVEPLEPARHGRDLHAAYSLDREGRLWTYLFSGPFATEGEFMQWLAPRQASDDPLFFAIVQATTGRAVGLASYLHRQVGDVVGGDLAMRAQRPIVPGVNLMFEDASSSAASTPWSRL